MPANFLKRSKPIQDRDISRTKLLLKSFALAHSYRRKLAFSHKVLVGKFLRNSVKSLNWKVSSVPLFCLFQLLCCIFNCWAKIQLSEIISISSIWCYAPLLVSIHSSNNFLVFVYLKAAVQLTQKRDKQTTQEKFPENVSMHTGRSKICCVHCQNTCLFLIFMILFNQEEEEEDGCETYENLGLMIGFIKTWSGPLKQTFWRINVKFAIVSSKVYTFIFSKEN